MKLLISNEIGDTGASGIVYNVLMICVCISIKCVCIRKMTCVDILKKVCKMLMLKFVNLLILIIMVKND